MSPGLRAHLYIISANILFGLNYSYSKTVVGWMPPEALTLARIFVAAVMFLIIALTVVRERVAAKDMWLLVLASLFGIGGNQFMFLKGLESTSPVDAAIIATVGPVLVLVLSAILGRDRITLRKSFGIGLGACGALLVIFYGGLASFGKGHLAGNLLVFSAAASYACYLIVVKELIVKYSPVTIMAWIFGVSALIMVPAFGRSLLSVGWGGMPSGAWGPLVFVIVGATCLAYICVAGSLKGLTPTTASIYTYSQPVIASVFAVLRGQDRVDWVKVLAALLVFLGVFIVTRSYGRDAVAPCD